jgi:hypothetical protein
MEKSGYAQAGFQGRRNEISIDVLNLALRGEFNAMYKFALGKSYVVFLNYAKTDLDRTMHNPMGYNLTYTDGSTQIGYGYDDVLSGKSEFSLSTYGFGVLWTKNYFNMNMPVGVYFGLGTFISNGELTETYNFKPGLLGSGSPILYDINQFNLRAIYGNEFVLSGMLTMDISLAIGFTSGKYSLKNPVADGLISSNPFSEFPQTPFSGANKTEDWNIDYSGLETHTAKKTSIFFGPSIRIGYMF